MSAGSLRQQLATQLEAALPARKYRVVAELAVTDRLAKPLVQVRQARIEPAPTAQGLSRVSFEIEVVTHYEGVTRKAEDAVDQLGVEVFETLLTKLPYTNPLYAEKGSYADKYLSYTIHTEVLTQRS